MVKNNRRLAMAIVTAYLADYLFNLLYHGHFMMESYSEIASIRRPEDELGLFSGYAFLGHLILVSIAGIIFSRGFERKGIMEGFRFGLLIGLLLASQVVTAFAFNPFPTVIFSSWIIGYLLEGVIIGLSLALIYGIKLDDEKKEKPAKKARAKKKK